MRFFVMFVTAVCVLFLIKLRWPKKKNFYDTILVIPYPYNYLVSYPLSLKLSCQLSLIPKTPNRASSLS